MKLLVTGGLGYVGGRFHELAAAQPGIQLTLTTRRPPPRTTDTPIVQVQPDDAEGFARLCKGVDAIVHLSGMNAAECARDPAGAIAARSSSVATLLAAAIRQDVPRFVYLSTAHVYGAALTGRVDEDTVPRPTHPYAHSHFAAEERVRKARANGAIDALVVRLSNAYGAPNNDAGEAWKLVANQLCRDAVRTRQIVLKTQGQQRRDFIAMSEACRALLHCCRAPAENFATHTLNAGGGDAPSIVELARRIAARIATRLNFEPTITLGQDQDLVGAGPLEFVTDRLRQTGFEPDAGAGEAELDRLIDHCAGKIT